MNKIDLGQRWAEDRLQAFLDVGTTPTVRTCAISGLGIEELRAALDKLLDALQPQDFISGSPAEACVVGTIRNEGLLRKAKDAIVSAISALCYFRLSTFDFRPSKGEAWPEFDASFASRDLDEALEAFDELLGIEVGVNILDEIFSRFCIGK
jgi:tRNA U34 5-carboxymethylaminomethyl modifying GTPase MnmE/TrmE